ncbi:MAG: hypothetical protein K2M48_06935, partial [Clostridiales bacterium]|nr:hypothetical protein [Clostridiales bacterium]
FGDSGRDGFAGVVNEFKQAAAIMEALEDTQKNVLALDPDALLSNFLSNHDNDRSAENFASATDIKKGAALYLLAPGNPYIYYGEEIGAFGSGRDENKRLAFNWGDKRKVKDPSDADYKEKQEYGTVKSQTTDANSILTYYRNAIKIRNRFPEIGRGLMTAYALNADGKLTKTSDIRSSIGKEGSLYTVNSRNMSIAAYTLTWNDREVLIVHNVGKKETTIDASAFADHEVVATLKANGGKVSFADGSLTMSSGTVAVLKLKSTASE